MQRLLTSALVLTLTLALAAAAAGAVGDLGPQQRVSAGGGMHAFPALAANPDRNEYLAVWTVISPPGAEIHGRVLGPGGQPRGEQFQISGPTTGGGAYGPEVTYNPISEEYLVAWVGSTIAGDSEIYIQRLSASGAELGVDDQRVSDLGIDGDMSYSAGLPSVVHNPARNEYLLAYRGDETSGADEVFIQRVAADGTALGITDQRISMMGPAGDANYGGQAPSVAYNGAADEYLVVWYGNDDRPGLAAGEDEIFMQRISATGVEVGTDDQLISSQGPALDTDYDAEDPAVVANGVDGDYLVAWVGDLDAGGGAQEREIVTQRLAADGTEIGSDDGRISTMGPNGDAAYGAAGPEVAHDSLRDQYLVAWAGDDGGALADNEFEIYAQRLSAAAEEIGTDDLRVSQIGPDGDPAYGPTAEPITALAYSSAAQEYLAGWWSDDDKGGLSDDDFEVFARAVSSKDDPPPTPPTTDPADTEVEGPDVRIGKIVVVKGKELKIKPKAGCQEPCTATATATVIDKPRKGGKKGKGKGGKKARYKLKPVSRSTDAGERATLRLKLKGGSKKRKKLTSKIVRSIGNRHKLRGRLVVEFSDTAGNTAVEKRVVRLKARKKGGSKGR